MLGPHQYILWYPYHNEYVAWAFLLLPCFHFILEAVLFYWDSCLADLYLEPLKKTLGHKITPANRDYLIDTFVEIFTSNPRIINDYDTICELETFQNVAKYDKNGKVSGIKREAAGNNHDDLVMSLIPLSMIRKQYTLPNSYEYYFLKESENKKENFTRKKTKVSAITRFTGIKW